MASEIDPYLQNKWNPAEIDCINLAKAFIKEFSIDTFLESFFNGVESFSDPLKSKSISFVNKHIFNSKSYTEQEQTLPSEAISFADHEEILSGTQLKSCRVFEEDMEIKCVTIHSDDDMKKHSKRMRAAVSNMKHKICCKNTRSVASNKYLITTWSLHGKECSQLMEMSHCLSFCTVNLRSAQISIDALGQYICIIHCGFVNIISRSHLIGNNICSISEMELQREGVAIDDSVSIFDVSWFYNKAVSQNLLLGIVLITDNNCFKFIVIDCKNKRVRRRSIGSNNIRYQFLKYPQISPNTLWGVCAPSDSKEMSIGIIGSHNGSTETGFQKFAQYYLLRNSNNKSKSWVASSSNGHYLAHFSGMNREKIQYTADRMISYRLGIIRVPQSVTVDDSDLSITFRSKPCGFTINQDGNRLNAWISAIKDDNPYVCEGLKIGLWIHTVNMKVVDNNAYKTILSVIRRAPAPLTIGFKYEAPDKSVSPQKLGTHFWYNTSLSLQNDTVCNGIYWLNNDIAVCVIGHKLYVLGHKTGARSRNKVLEIWMRHGYGMINYDVRGIVHKFIGFDLDHVYNIPDLNYDKAIIDFYYYKNKSIYCVYQNNKQQNKLIVL